MYNGEMRDHLTCLEGTNSLQRTRSPLGLSGRAYHDDLLIWDRLSAIWTDGPVVEFRLQHSVIVGSISGGEVGLTAKNSFRQRINFEHPKQTETFCV